MMSPARASAAQMVTGHAGRRRRRRRFPDRLLGRATPSIWLRPGDGHHAGRRGIEEKVLAIRPLGNLTKRGAQIGIEPVGRVILAEVDAEGDRLANEARKLCVRTARRHTFRGDHRRKPALFVRFIIGAVTVRRRFQFIGQLTLGWQAYPLGSRPFSMSSDNARTSAR